MNKQERALGAPAAGSALRENEASKPTCELDVLEWQRRQLTKLGEEVMRLRDLLKVMEIRAENAEAIIREMEEDKR